MFVTECDRFLRSYSIDFVLESQRKVKALIAFFFYKIAVLAIVLGIFGIYQQTHPNTSNDVLDITSNCYSSHVCRALKFLKRKLKRNLM